MVVVLSSSKMAKSLEVCAGKKDSGDCGSQVKMKSSALVNQSLGINFTEVELPGKHDLICYGRERVSPVIGGRNTDFICAGMMIFTRGSLELEDAYVQPSKFRNL
jgi:hypothetical protein